MVSRVVNNFHHIELLSFLSFARKLSSKEVTQLAQEIHQNNNTQTSELTNEDLKSRITILGGLNSKRQLLPKRSLWHLATLGISYLFVRIYDHIRASSILKEKQQLIDKYLAQMLTSLEPTKENIDILTRILFRYGNAKNTKEILKYALRHNQQELIEQCRGLPIENAPEDIAQWNKIFQDLDADQAEEGQYPILQELIAKGMDINVRINGKTALEIACEKRDFALADVLIKAGAHIDKYALISAIRQGQGESIARILIEAGVDLNIESPDAFDNQRAILMAIDRRQWGVVHALINKGVDLNVQTTHSGSTPLTLAIEKGADTETIGLIINGLVKAGLSLDTQSTFTPPALVLAARKGQLEVVKALVQAGANIKISERGGFSALESAIRNGHEEVALYLIEKDARISGDIFRLAWQNSLPKAALAIREKMLARPSKPGPKYKLPGPKDIRCEKPPIPFLSASRQLAPKPPPMLPLPPPSQGYSQMIASLEPNEDNIAMLNKIADIGTAAHRQEILKYALRHNHQGLIKECRAYRIENTPEEIKKWKHVISTAYGPDDGEDKYAMFKELIANGIDVNIKINGKTALEIAMENRDTDCVRDLIQAGARIDKLALISAIAKGFGADLLIAAGVDLNVTSSNLNERPILMAIMKQDWRIVLALIHKGVDLNVHTPHTAFTPLTLAIEQGADLEVITAIIDALIKTGVSLDTEFDNRPPALALAASKGQLELVKQLLAKGARCDTRAEATELTALESAIENGHEEVALYLMAHNSPVSRDVLKRAKRKNLPQVIAVLREKFPPRLHEKMASRVQLGRKKAPQGPAPQEPNSVAQAQPVQVTMNGRT